MRSLLTLLLLTFILQSQAAQFVSVDPMDEKGMLNVNTLMPDISTTLVKQNLDCQGYSPDMNYLRWHIPGVSAESSDRDKVQRIAELDGWVGKLASLKHCPYLENLCIGIPEGMFIKTDDELDFSDKKKWNKKAWKLDMERFLTRYERKLSDWFTETTVYLVSVQEVS